MLESCLLMIQMIDVTVVNIKVKHAIFTMNP